MQIAGASAHAIIWYCVPKLFWYVICFSSQINMPPFKYPSCESIKDTVCLPGGEISTTTADMNLMAFWQPWDAPTMPYFVIPRAVRKVFPFEIEHFGVVISCSVILGCILEAGAFAWQMQDLGVLVKVNVGVIGWYRHRFDFIIVLFSFFITRGSWSEDRFWNFIFRIKAVEFFCCLFCFFNGLSDQVDRKSSSCGYA